MTMSSCITHFIQEIKCPYCEHPIDALSGTRQPKEGDISLCGYCGGLLVIHLELNPPVVPITDEELLALEPAELQMLKDIQERLQKFNQELKEEYSVPIFVDE
jgi:hypothetical protein